jgi:hypothetical protein
MPVLERLSARNFRIIRSLDLDFAAGLNVVEGRNGSGKTSLLEMIYLLGTGKSFRTSRAADYISTNEQRTLITGTVRVSPDERPSMLGIGCSDPSSAGLNGTQSGLGPRSQINAATGFFPFPYTPPAGISNLLSRRIQIALDDLNPSLNSGAQYFAEAQYIHPDDAAAGNDNNNASYRKFTIGSLVSGSYNLSLTGPTTQQKPAIFAWKDSDATVTINSVDVPNDGRFFVGYKVKANGNGTWNYEFAIFNLNSDRSGGSFSVPIPDGVNVTNIKSSAFSC